MALYYVKSILTEISASRQDRRVLQKSKIIRIEFLSKWGMLQTSRYVQNSRNLEKTILTEISQCTAVLYNDWSLQMGQMGPKMTLGTLKMNGNDFPGVQGVLRGSNSVHDLISDIYRVVFFYWSALKMTKYEEKLKCLNWSANCSSQKVLSVNSQ